MFCRQCGKEIEDGIRFCVHCGAAQEVGDKASAAVTLEEKVPAEVPASNSETGNEKEVQQKKTEKGKGGLIAALAAIVLVIAAGVGITLYFTSDGYHIKKDMKLAEECFAEGEYKEALAYYEDALKLDNTLAEAYLGAADAYLARDNYEDAVDILKKGLKKSSDDEEIQAALSEKLVETYQKAVEDHMNRGDYGKAYSMAQEGIDGTGASVLTAGKTQVYLREAGAYMESGDISGALQVLNYGMGDIGDGSQQQELRQKQAEIYGLWTDNCLAAGDYSGALSVLGEGANVTGDTGLGERKVAVYGLWTDACLAVGDYNSALSVLGEGANVTGDAGLGERKIGVYRRESDAFLEAGDCLSAVQALMDGGQDTGSPALAEREAYLRENIVLIREYWDSGDETVYDAAGHVVRSVYVPTAMDAGGINEWEYDAAGNLVKSTFSTYEGEVYQWNEYEYDTAGNKTKEIGYSTYSGYGSVK